MNPAQSRAEEWKAHWPLVLAATVGFSFNSITSYSVGLFMEPLHQAFGWSRTTVSAGMSIGALVAVLLSVPVGKLIDKWGTRRIALPGLFFASCAFAAFGMANGSVAQWMGLWTIYALILLSTKSTIWTFAVSGVFNAGRSLAIAMTLSGAALAQILTPPITNWLIEHQGWRMAYVWLGLGWGGVALILTFFFLFDSLDRQRLGRDKVAVPVSLGGLTLRQALRTPALIRIGLATLITLALGLAAIVHEVPILMEAGVSRTDAAWLAALTGIASIVGKLVTGWLMEKQDAGWVGSTTLAASSLAFLLLLIPGHSPVIIVTAMLVLGYTAGTKNHICAYLTSRYAGLRHFGAIFGVMSSLIALASGLGPVLAGLIFDHTGSYFMLMIIGVPGSLISGLLIFRLGAYPDWTPVQSAQEDVVAAQVPAGGMA